MKKDINIELLQELYTKCYDEFNKHPNHPAKLYYFTLGETHIANQNELVTALANHRNDTFTSDTEVRAIGKAMEMYREEQQPQYIKTLKQSNFRIDENSLHYELRMYLSRAESLQELSNVVEEDKHATDSIKRLESILEGLKQYRQELANRYNELSTMSAKYEVTLKRENTSYQGIKYFVYVEKIYEDGTRTKVQSERFDGKDRYTAFKRFEEVKKAYPTATYIKDIEKKYWEK